MELKHMLNDDTPNDRPLKRQSTSPPSETRHRSDRDLAQDMPALHLHRSGLSKFAGRYTCLSTKDSNDSEPKDDTAMSTAMDIFTSPYFLAGAQRGSGSPTPAGNANSGVHGVVENTVVCGEQHDSGTTSPLDTPDPPTRQSISSPHTANGIDLTTESPLPYLQNVNLYHLTAEQRREHYRDLFENIDIPLKSYVQPSLCNQYPNLATEIRTAYFEHVTFSLNIWVNYDGSTRYFYNDPKRKKDCGKLAMSPRERDRLEKMGIDQFAFHKIKLEIGTPFRTFATLFLTKLEDAEMGVDTIGKARPEHKRTHQRLMGLCIAVLKELVSEDFQAQSTKGIFMSHLEQIAAHFCREPREDDDSEDLFRNFEG